MKNKIIFIILLLLVVACQKQPTQEEIERAVPKETPIVTEVIKAPEEVVEKVTVPEEVAELTETKVLYKYGNLRSQNRQTVGNVKINLIKRGKEEFFLVDLINFDMKIFKGDNIEKIHIYLSGDSNPKNLDVVKRAYFDLGKLQTVSGFNSFTLSAGVDVSKYRSLVVVQEDPESLFAVATLVEPEKPDAKIG
ncbi:MAG: hypothetical protein QW331_02175 [Candidatus Woesearchaeota archaeon]